MKAIRILVVLFFTVSMAGCVTYTPPREGPTARIQFEGDGDSVTIDTVGRLGRKCFSIPRVRGEDWRVQTIPSGQRLWLTHSWSGYKRSCGFSFSFVPDRGATYVSDLRVRGDQCRLQLARQLESGARVSEDSYRKVEESCSIAD